MLPLLLNFTICLAALAIAVWMAGAIYFDLGGATATGRVLAVLWMGLAVAVFAFWQPPWKPFLLVLVGGGCFVWWWLSQRPSLDRNWDPYFTRLPRVEICGDKITIEHVRHAEYGIADGEAARFETRNYRLSELCGVDALIAYWGSPWMCHPMFVFDFGPAGRVCFSIEVRYRVGQVYSFLRSIYRQQEIMCVACDERDAILRRTKRKPNQDVYLYRLQGDGVRMRSFFFEYVNTINALAEQPQWYNGLTTNCTTSIYAQGRSRLKWDWRMLFNGKLDELLYDLKLLDQSMPFLELKTRSKINEPANCASVEDFGETIRRGLPGYRRSAVLDAQEVDEIGSYRT